MFFCLSPCSFSWNRYLNESSVLNVLRQRYGNNLIHTYAGPSIININPMANLAIYSEKIIQMFKECQLEDMPPHIYSVAQQVRYFEFSSSFFSWNRCIRYFKFILLYFQTYRAMLRTRKDQSVAFIGRSGSGKSTNAKHCLSALVVTSNCANKCLTMDKMNAIHTLLEAFGHSRTIMNSNATRFVNIFYSHWIEAENLM